jgi:hypothetical protein
MVQVAVLVEEPVHRDFKVAEDRAEVAQLVLELCRAEPMVVVEQIIVKQQDPVPFVYYGVLVDRSLVPV